MSSRGFDARLEEGLDRLVAGDRAELAAGFSWSMAELEELLSAGAWVSGLPHAFPDQEKAGQSRSVFLARGAYKHRAWVDEQARSREINVVSGVIRAALDRRLDEAISRLLEGEEPQRATGINWLMAEVEDLLRPAVLLSGLHRAEPDQAARVRSRNLFTDAAGKLRARWEARHFRPRASDAALGLLGRSLTRRLDAAISDAVAGHSAHGLGRTAADMEVKDLLLGATTLIALPHEQADRGARTRVRNIFMAQAAHRRVAWVHHHDLPLSSTKKHAPRSQPRRVRGTALLTLFVILAVILGAGAAGAAGVSEPDSGLYPLKQAAEAALLRLAGDPVSHADTEVKLAAQRMREAEAMAIRDQPEYAVRAVRNRYDALRTAASDLGGHPAHDQRWQKARDRLKDEEGKPITPIEQALTRANHPDAAAAVKQEAEKFQNDRKVLDRDLGTPQPSPDLGPSPGQP
jgi:hypothetical protein